MQQSQTADGVLLRALCDVAATRVGVAMSNRVGQVLQGEFELAQLVQVGLHLVLLDEATHRHHIGHAGHLTQRAFNAPVLQGAQLRGGLAIATQSVAHDFADGCGVWRNLCLYAFGQVDAAQAFIHLLANHVHFGVVVVSHHGE